MAEEVRKNGSVWASIGGIGGLAVAVISLAWSQMESIGRDASTALEVVAQHGEEFLVVNQRVERLIVKLADIEAKMNIGGRFTVEDGARLRAEHHTDFSRVERDIERIREQVEKLQHGTL